MKYVDIFFQLTNLLSVRNPDWGLPDIDVLRQLAFGNGMRMERMVRGN